ncbi:MAG: hypothetical protein GWM92_07370 [Gemmatimonadetes bacterium]|nr:hypothetical protein [Gemmatimonadota bacterium]NIR78446.1 hypothetical protein [Gemmatimonadota bacterium]NIT87056.1 hypothetical protein [Gemmatimonadota bacterium]NIU30895.1 hypothetical protein [Gemmatimonadota bacterium]NIU35658.1 hypothetical protein [Gemmatimonadota bacterium]
MRRFLVRTALATVVVFGAMACEGPEGPVGPQGPEGPEGPAGPGTRLTFQGQLDSFGDATVNLPQEAGTLDDPPSVSCFVSDVAEGLYISIASVDGADPACGFNDTASGNLAAIIVGAPADWFYRIVVIY